MVDLLWQLGQSGECEHHEARIASLALAALRLKKRASTRHDWSRHGTTFRDDAPQAIMREWIATPIHCGLKAARSSPTAKTLRAHSLVLRPLPPPRGWSYNGNILARSRINLCPWKTKKPSPIDCFR
jgi:hypothetical protein